MYLTLHSYGQMFLYPWGYDRVDHNKEYELRRLGNVGARAMGRGYTVGSAAKVRLHQHHVLMMIITTIIRSSILLLEGAMIGLSEEQASPTLTPLSCQTRVPTDLFFQLQE